MTTTSSTRTALPVSPKSTVRSHNQKQKQNNHNHNHNHNDNDNTSNNNDRNTMSKTPKSALLTEAQQDVPIFLRKTFHMVDTCDPAIACWSDDGETFIVKDPSKFQQTVIPQFFKHSKFTSFVRQLNFYAFRKIKYADTIRIDPQLEAETANYWRFRHEKFQRGRPDLLGEIKRMNGQKHKAQSHANTTNGSGNSGSAGGGAASSNGSGNSSLAGNKAHTSLNSVPQDKENAALKSEVSTLKDKIDAMTKNIDQLTSMVEKVTLATQTQTQADAEAGPRSQSQPQPLTTVSEKTIINHNNKRTKVLVEPSSMSVATPTPTPTPDNASSALVLASPELTSSMNMELDAFPLPPSMPSPLPMDTAQPSTSTSSFLSLSSNSNSNNNHNILNTSTYSGHMTSNMIPSSSSPSSPLIHQPRDTSSSSDLTDEGFVDQLFTAFKTEDLMELPSQNHAVVEPFIASSESSSSSSSSSSISPNAPPPELMNRLSTALSTLPRDIQELIVDRLIQAITVPFQNGTGSCNNSNSNSNNDNSCSTIQDEIMDMANVSNTQTSESASTSSSLNKAAQNPQHIANLQLAAATLSALLKQCNAANALDGHHHANSDNINGSNGCGANASSNKQDSAQSQSPAQQNHHSKALLIPVH